MWGQRDREIDSAQRFPGWKNIDKSTKPPMQIYNLRLLQPRVESAPSGRGSGRSSLRVRLRCGSTM